MNYLAHFHLADAVASTTGYNGQALLIGGLLGDFVKGPLKGALPLDWEVGIRLHRRIDALTDAHPLTRQCLDDLPPAYRRYGGIMLDLCFDHCLSRQWSAFHRAPLAHFNRRAYDQVLAQADRFPRAASRQIGVLAQHDVLSGMADWARIEAMLGRIGQRIVRANPLAECGPVLARQLPVIEARFLELYPQLLANLTRDFATLADSPGH